LQKRIPQDLVNAEVYDLKLGLPPTLGGNALGALYPLTFFNMTFSFEELGVIFREIKKGAGGGCTSLFYVRGVEDN
jgi:hypothetical protein